MPFIPLGHLMLAFGYCFIFVKGYEGTGIGEGLRYGLYVGIGFGLSSNLINYTVFQWPGAWIGSWAVGETLIMSKISADKTVPPLRLWRLGLGSQKDRVDEKGQPDQ